MFTFGVGKQLISPPKMFPWQRKFNSPPASSKLISSFFGGATGTDPMFQDQRIALNEWNGLIKLNK